MGNYIYKRRHAPIYNVIRHKRERLDAVTKIENKAINFNEECVQLFVFPREFHLNGLAV